MSVAFDFVWPWFLLALPLAAGAVIWIDRATPSTIARWKRRLFLGLRLTVILLLVASLAGLRLSRDTSERATLFVCDLSDSTEAVRKQMSTFVGDALKTAGERELSGVVSFARDGLVEYPLSPEIAYRGLESVVNSSFTDLQTGLRLAQALLPDDTVRRLVLLSDGQHNLGAFDVAQEARALAQSGVAVDVVHMASEQQREVQISKLRVPSHVYSGEKYRVEVRVDSTVATTGILRLYENRQLVRQQQVDIQPGTNPFVFEHQATKSGIFSFEATLETPDDTQPRNNSMSAVQRVQGAARVMVVEGTSGNGQTMVNALTAAGMIVEKYAPGGMPVALSEWNKYQAAVWVNVNAEDVDPAVLDTMEAFVRQLGRGFLATGGDNSYIFGDYLDTPLQAMLPVDLDVKNRMDVPSLGLVLVIDKSGSMTEGQYGITKLELAKEAAMRSAEALKFKDQIGVIAFDDKTQWVVPPRQIQDENGVRQIQDDIGTIRPGGGTMMYGPLAHAMDALNNMDTQLKHIICLTDGQPADRGFELLASEMAQQGITLSTVAVGREANGSLLEALAEIGGGRYYECDVFDDIPKVFTKETYLATQSYLQNRTFYPKQVGMSPILNGFDALPPLHGYLTTTIKSAASEVLSSDKDDPILAEWLYGLGRVIAWTPDMEAWSRDYVAWEDGGLFFGQMVSRLLPDEELGSGTIETRVEGDKGFVALETGDVTQQQAEVNATVLDPDGVGQEVRLQLTQPGRYEGNFDAEQPGVYLVRLEQTVDGEIVNRLESGVSVSYSPEFDIQQDKSAGLGILTQLAQLTGGRVLNADEAGRVYEADPRRIAVITELWPIMLMMALVLFVIDIAVRRLKIEAIARRVAVAVAPVKDMMVKAVSKRRVKVVESEPPTESPEKPQTEKQKTPERKAVAKPEGNTAAQLLSSRKGKQR